jgi:hypothetical protein
MDLEISDFSHDMEEEKSSSLSGLEDKLNSLLKGSNSISNTNSSSYEESVTSSNVSELTAMAEAMIKRHKGKNK